MTSRINCSEKYEIRPTNHEVGMSGIPGLAKDKYGKRYFVKCSDIYSIDHKKQIESLTYEENALANLSGFVSPVLIDVCSRFERLNDDDLIEKRCLIMELLDDADRVENEKCFSSLQLYERVEILAQFFACLSKAHSQCFTNGDIDLKHLFWQRKHGRLIIIDWGNSRKFLDKNSLDFSFDIAKSAEVFFMLANHTKNITEDTNLSLLPSDVPDIFKRLCAWSPRKGRPHENVSDFSAENLSLSAQSWAKRNYLHISSLKSKWIQKWIIQPEGGDWVIDLSENLRIAPHCTISNIASQALEDFERVQILKKAELSYENACNVKDWVTARNIINRLIVDKFIPENVGYLLSQTLFNISRKPNEILVDDKYSLIAIIEALGEIVDERESNNGGDGVGEALIELAARSIFKEMPIDLDNSLKKKELIFPLHIFFNEHNIDKSQYSRDNGTLSWFTGTPQADTSLDLKEALYSYKNLLSTLRKVIDDYGESEVSINNMTQKVYEITKLLEAAICAFENQEYPSALRGLKRVWTLDPCCISAYKKWIDLRSSTLPEIRAISLPRCQAYVLQDAIKYFHVQMVQILSGSKTNEEKAYKFNQLLYEIPPLLPIGWQLYPPIIEWLCSIDAFLETLRLGQPPDWFNNLQLGGEKLLVTEKVIEKILSSRKEQGRITDGGTCVCASSTLPSDEVIKNLELDKTSPIHIKATGEKRYRQEEVKSTQDDSSFKATSSTSLDLNKGNDTDQSDKSSQSRKAFVIVSLLLLAVILLTINWFTWGRSIIGSSTLYKQSYTVTFAAKEILLTPTISTTPTHRPTETKAISQTPTEAASQMQTNQKEPQPQVYLSRLLQFDRYNETSASQPFSIIIQPPLPMSQYPELKNYKAGLYYDAGLKYWIMKSFPKEIVNKIEDLDPLYANFGILFAGNRLRMARSFSVISDGVILSKESGSVGLYFKDKNQHKVEILIDNANEQLSLDIVQDNELIQKIPIVIQGNALEMGNRLWLYIQIREDKLQLFMKADSPEIIRNYSLSDLPFITSIPWSSEIDELGLVSYSEGEWQIVQMVLYGE